jgi:hypothetical protein
MASLQHLAVNIWSSSNVMAIPIYNPTIWVQNEETTDYGRKVNVARVRLENPQMSKLYYESEHQPFRYDLFSMCR